MSKKPQSKAKRVKRPVVTGSGAKAPVSHYSCLHSNPFPAPSTFQERLGLHSIAPPMPIRDGRSKS